MFVFKEKSIKTLYGVHPTLVKFAHELIKIAPYEFSIVEGVRTLDTQKYYYTLGRTKFVNRWGLKIKSPITMCDGVVRKSQHQIQNDGYSHAFDIVFSGKTQAESYSQKKFKELLIIAKPLMAKYGIEWGGDWVKYRDCPHFQLKLK